MSRYFLDTQQGYYDADNISHAAELRNADCIRENINELIDDIDFSEIDLSPIPSRIY